MSRLAERIRAVFSHPRAHVGVIVLSLLLAATSLWSGLCADDHVHRLILQESTAIEGFQRGQFDLFRFADPEHNRTLMDNGTFPWWADPEVRLAFFRPVTSLTHFVDHVLWPERPFFAHLQTVLWFGLGLLGIWSLYRRLIHPGWVVVLALAFYALDDARGSPISWLANRNAVVACTLSIWALLFHHRYCSDGWKPGLPLALATFTAALGAAEGAVAICAYLFAYSLFLDRGLGMRRWIRLVPYAVMVVLWRATSKALGYGVVGSGVYVDPSAEPAAFVAMIVERLPILMLAQIAGPWSEVWNATSLLLPGLEFGLAVLATAMLTAMGLLAVPLWKRSPVLRFWIVGSVLSAIPSCATFPADRLLSWVAIGAMPALALLFAGLVDEKRRVQETFWRPKATVLVAFSLVVLHLVIAPLTFPIRARGAEAVREMLTLANDSVPKTPDISNKTVVAINPPADPFIAFLPFMRADAGEPLVGTQRWLATGATDVLVERIDARTLRVRPDSGFLLSPSEQLFRSPRRPFAKNERVELRGMTVEITELEWDGRPAEAVIRFDRPLEDPEYVWLAWKGRSYVPFEPPKIGASVVLPKVDFFELAYG